MSMPAEPLPVTHLIVFDLDGTLVDTAPDLIGALNHAMAAESLSPVPVSAAHHLVGAGVRALIERGLAHHKHSVSLDRFEQLMAIFIDYYTENIAQFSRPYPGVIDALLDLQSQGWRFAICTNKPERLAEKLVRDLKMRHWFEYLAGGDSFDFKKPDPRHLTETIAKSGFKDAVMVGDSRTDVDTARAAGVPVVGVTFGYTDIPMRDLKPDVLIERFDQLAGALHGLT
jgi:phosphoglycolate phosphatase